jgi:hypothetical protein
LALAISGFVLAKANSRSVSAIRTDRSQELEAARIRAARLEKAQDREEKGDAAAPQEPDAEGATDTDAPPDAEEPRRTYRAKGKVARTAGRKKEDPVLVAAQRTTEASGPRVRVMAEADVLRANSLDRVNLVLARFTVWLAVVLVLADYLSRLNRAFDAYLPLPIACRLLDALFPKQLVVRIPTQVPEAWKQALACAVRKGETFLYFTETDPWPDATLPRLRVGSCTLRSLTKTAPDTCATAAPGNRFLFESLWFGRWCVVVEGTEHSRAVLDDLILFLRTRHAVLASARRTVNVAWGLAAPLPEETILELAFLCRETNFRLLLPPSADPGGRRLAIPAPGADNDVLGSKQRKSD